jgi:hypothetical protein
MNLDGKVFTGIYVVEVKTAFDRSSIKFIKNKKSLLRIMFTKAPFQGLSYFVK